MTSVPAYPMFEVRSVVVDAVRCRHIARRAGRPIMPALFTMLNRHQCGMLAPVLDSLIALFENCSGRAFKAGDHGDITVSSDENGLLDMLQAADGREPNFRTGSSRVRLSSAMKTAIRSTRIMMRLALGRAANDRRALRFVDAPVMV